MGVLHAACLILLLKSTTGFRCGPNSHFNVSATACPITCENKDNPPPCNLGCVPRCECNNGFVLDNLGNCVRVCDCRIACGPNSRFNPYAPGCPATCANKELRRSCKKAPVARCECIPGYILNHEGKCIRECDCPSCGPNQRFNPVATGCPITCENRGIKNLCTVKPRPRCECIDGFVLDVNGVCVAEGSCPRCAPNSRYRFCGTACPKTCENKGLDVVCNRKCVPGCVCRDGYVLDHLGNCIRECDCPSCPANAHFEPKASACQLNCENKDFPVQCKLGVRPGCVCNSGFILDINGVCIPVDNCPKCAPNSRFKSCASACPLTCANKGAPIACTKQCVARCDCNPGFVLDHEGNCIPERNCPRCEANSHFEPRAPVCVRTCQNMLNPGECKLGFKARCICNDGFVLDHNGVCILEGNCPRCGPNQVFNPKASACQNTCQNVNADKECALGVRARCECIRGFVLDHEGNCIDARNCPRCRENEVFNPRASVCVRTCQNLMAERECTLGFKARCQCARGYVINHEGICIPERNCPSCPANAHFEPLAPACLRTCENMFDFRHCTLGKKARCVCDAGFVLDHNGVCILEGNCPRCGPNQKFNPKASACVRTCQNLKVLRKCSLGFGPRCECIRGFVMDHEGNCIRERNCPNCQANAHFEPRASACIRTCQNMRDYRDCTLGKKARCVCNKEFILDHNGVCILEGNCPRCGPNQIFNPRASACVRTCANRNRLIKCNRGFKPLCECIRGFALDHDGNCIPERNCPRCPDNAHFVLHASVCRRTCQNKYAIIECTLGFKSRCVCNAGFILDHNGNCILESNCPRCGPYQFFNPFASACIRTCQNMNVLRKCKLGFKPKCQCIRGFVLDHGGNCIPERNCPSCPRNSHFQPHASACLRTCQNMNAIMECTLGFKARCVCNRGFILDHNGVCIFEGNCPRCGPNQVFNPRASSCIRTCENKNVIRECNLGFKARCECKRGFVLDHEGNCIAERNCPTCADNSHFEPRAIACIRTCENMNSGIQCTLGIKARCICDPGFVRDHNGVCILEGNCPRCGPNQIFNPRASACLRTCENRNSRRECSLGLKARCECIRGFVLDHDGNCIPERNCPSCADNSHFEPRAIACVRTCENMNRPMECTLGFKPRCVCDKGFVLDHNGICISEGNCPRCGPNQIFNPRASACPCTCENPNASKGCKLGPKARCDCIRGFVLDHEGNCIDERNCPRCQENAHFQPRASACIRTCENMNALVDCTLGFKARCVCNKGFILDHNGVCIREANCPRCGPNQIFNPRASACACSCENPNASKECKLGSKARCECIRGFVLDHEGNCIDARNCPRCGPNQIFNPRASACACSCENPNASKECKLGSKARCECIRGFVLDHEGNCIDARNCPRCQENASFQPRASACIRTCENMNALIDCTLGFKARCVCNTGFILDHNGVCIREANCPRCGPNQIFNPRASICSRTCQNPNADKQCKVGLKARCECVRGFVLDHEGNCIDERNCPRCRENEHFEPRALACIRTCENMNALVDCTLGFKARCICDNGFVLDHNGVCIREANCPRCGPNEIFNPRASGCACTCENPNASKDCKLGPKARCECIRGYILDHNGVCIPEANCPRCGLFEVFNPRASGCVRTCENWNAIGQCSLGIKARCECIPGYVLDHKGNCIRENKCPSCGPNSHFNPTASACLVTCQNMNSGEECNLGTEARCECDAGYVLDHNGVCIKPCKCIKCAPHSHFNPQASACPITCDNFDQARHCHLGLVARCECDDGYILHPNGNCVEQCDCPVKCPPNAHYNASASACPITCRNKENPPICNLPNVARCQCDDGFALNSNGVCIPECDCQPKCGANEHFNWCAPVEPITCLNRNSPRDFSETCVARCECNDGFILNREGKCVKECECKECRPNAHYSDCVSNCPRTCTNLNEALLCTKECRSGGCECDEGFVFDNYGNCVREHDCPDPRCGRHAFFSHHLPNIQITCANRHQRRDVEFSYCSEGGCRCKNGFVLDGYSNCILESDCPK